MKFIYFSSMAVLLIFVLQLPACAEQQDVDYAYSDIKKFWPVFRSAALNGDKAILLKLAQFPISLHGIEDDDPVIKMDRASFSKNIDIILAQDPGDPSTIKPETTLDLIKRTIVLQDQDGFARVGDLEFHLIEDTWLWVRSYIDQDKLSK